MKKAIGASCPCQRSVYPEIRCELNSASANQGKESSRFACARLIGDFCANTVYLIELKPSADRMAEARARQPDPHTSPFERLRLPKFFQPVERIGNEVYQLWS